MLKQIGTFQYLSLTNLTLSQFPNLKRMRGILMFPSLKSLKLSKLASLEELWTTIWGFQIQEDELSAQYCFFVLFKLSIQGCLKLDSGGTGKGGRTVLFKYLLISVQVYKYLLILTHFIPQ